MQVRKYWFKSYEQFSVFEDGDLNTPLGHTSFLSKKSSTMSLCLCVCDVVCVYACCVLSAAPLHTKDPKFLEKTVMSPLTQ